MRWRSTCAWSAARSRIQLIDGVRQVSVGPHARSGPGRPGDDLHQAVGSRQHEPHAMTDAIAAPSRGRGAVPIRGVVHESVGLSTEDSQGVAVCLVPSAPIVPECDES